MPSARRLLQQGVKATAAAVDLVRRPAPGVTVLIYHRVGGGSGLEVDLAPDRFEAQIAELAASGRVRSLADALELLAGPPVPGPGPIVITFDDGTVDLADVAAPILARHGVPATLYVATRHIDEQVPFPAGGTPLSWAALAECVASGVFSVGSHTHSHALLDRLPAAEVDDELDRSIALIEDRLGVTPLDFAYPKAVPGSAAAEAAVRARFRSAALAGTRANRPGRTDPHRLARSPIQVGDEVRWFRRKADGGLRAEDELRQLVNRRRYSAATT